MVEIISEEQNKVKRMKRVKDSLRPLQQYQMHQHWNNKGPRRREKKGYEKIFEENIVENFPNMEKEIVNQVQEAKSPIQDKPKEKHTNMCTNQTKKD